MVEERVTYIDFAKGMVVLLMIMGHCHIHMIFDYVMYFVLNQK